MTEWTAEPNPGDRITDMPLYMTAAGEHITDIDRLNAKELAKLLARPVIIRPLKPRRPWWKFWTRKANK